MAVRVKKRQVIVTVVQILLLEVGFDLIVKRHDRQIVVVKPRQVNVTVSPHLTVCSAVIWIHFILIVVRWCFGLTEVIVNYRLVTGLNLFLICFIVIVVSRCFDLTEVIVNYRLVTEQFHQSVRRIVIVIVTDRTCPLSVVMDDEGSLVVTHLSRMVVMWFVM